MVPDVLDYNTCSPSIVAVSQFSACHTTLHTNTNLQSTLTVEDMV